MRLGRSSIVGVILLATTLAGWMLFFMASPAPAHCLLKTYNYGSDFSGPLFYSTNLGEAAATAGYWQDRTPGFYARWPICNRELASSPFNNMQVTTVGMINIHGHGDTSADRSEIVLHPPNVNGATLASCLYSRGASRGPHQHYIASYNANCTGYKRIQDVSTIPTNMKLAVFQACESGNYAYSGVVPVAKAAWAEGVDTSVGFTDKIEAGYVGGDSIDGFFNSGYWYALSVGTLNSVAMDQGVDAVEMLGGGSFGYESHARWGTDISF